MVRREGTRRAHAGAQAEDDTDTGSNTRVKTEEVVLPSSLVVGYGSGEESTAACRVGSGRNKRKGRTSAPAAQGKTDAGSSGAIGGSSSRRGSGKRARRAMDDDEVVVLEAEDPPAGRGRTGRKNPGARVAIKPEH